MSMFVYGIVGAAEPEFEPLRGIGGRPVTSISHDGICAIVSDHPGGAIRPERKHILAQQQVLSALYRRYDMLPMAFGTLTPSREALAEFLGSRHADIAAMLERVRGCVEFGLQIKLYGPDPITYLVARSQELKAARDRAFGRRRAPTQQEQIRLGQLFESVFTQFRGTVAEKVSEGIAPAAAEVKLLPPRSQTEIANFAVLARRAEADLLAAAIEAVAADFGDEFVFGLNGPWPPHNFVSLDFSAGLEEA